MALKWITNIHKESLKLGRSPFYSTDIVADPKAMPLYSVAELKKMGFVGIYREEPEEGGR